jgi:hypothetical protein
MPLSHIKLYQLDNNIKIDMNPSLSTVLAADVATQTLTIGTSGFEE